MRVIKSIPAEATRPLRQRVLRPHQTIEQLYYPGDETATTFHLGAFRKQELVGISSIYHEAPPNSEDAGAWRLRGVATAPEVRGEGYGEQLLRAAIAYIARQGGTLVWCNARTTVMGYYERYGFQTRGDEFVVPGTGLHYFMWRAVVPNDTQLCDEAWLTTL